MSEPTPENDYLVQEDTPVKAECIHMPGCACRVTPHGVEQVIDNVVRFWNSNDGWLPGAAYDQLAEALGVSTDRLAHYDREQKRFIAPTDHQHRAGMAVIDGAQCFGQCIYWVDGVRCTEQVRYR